MFFVRVPAGKKKRLVLDILNTCLLNGNKKIKQTYLKVRELYLSVYLFRLKRQTRANGERKNRERERGGAVHIVRISRSR